MRVFFFGMGYSSQASAEALRKDDPAVEIAGTVRDAGRAQALAAKGYDIRVFDGERPGALGEALSGASHVVVSTPPGAPGDPVLRHHWADLARAPKLEWLCYFSTVGVYGDFGGAWVDESTPCHPENERSRQRVVAEDEWRSFAREKGIPVLILRLAGIYGPQRSTFDRLRDGTARRIVKPGQVFNRIHVADIGRVTALAAQRRLGGVFNLADDEPAPPQDLIAYAAELMGVVPPPEVPFEAAEMTPLARSFYADNKRISNAAIKAALGIDLLYPNYREGLSAIAN
ncbi:SDR family oxidoreductase [Paradevosia shaoguanensis]|uniref:SDR family oxidoreductase n=1 Tax=Paradevosia shaoguanensis TaxID=1335043 RepID=UPI0019333EF6|nr:SDR family oxidoreductase [Paradevosia shaoguanensis]